MRDRYLPIIIGAYEEADKCSIWGRNRILKSGKDLFICRLKRKRKRGQIESLDLKNDIESICCHIHFCRKEALEVFVKSAQKVLDEWDDEE